CTNGSLLPVRSQGTYRGTERVQKVFQVVIDLVDDVSLVEKRRYGATAVL
ncbi:hypothetical protein KUCAC02_037072, partial [Chaenocephalus aceratus]